MIVCKENEKYIPVKNYETVYATSGSNIQKAFYPHMAPS